MHQIEIKWTPGGGSVDIQYYQKTRTVTAGNGIWTFLSKEHGGMANLTLTGESSVSEFQSRIAKLRSVFAQEANEVMGEFDEKVYIGTVVGAAGLFSRIVVYSAFLQCRDELHQLPELYSILARIEKRSAQSRSINTSDMSGSQSQQTVYPRSDHAQSSRSIFSWDPTLSGEHGTLGNSLHRGGHGSASSSGTMQDPPYRMNAAEHYTSHLSSQNSLRSGHAPDSLFAPSEAQLPMEHHIDARLDFNDQHVLVQHLWRILRAHTEYEEAEKSRVRSHVESRS